VALTIGSNIASLRAQRRLNTADSALGRVYERLSSGQRINRAADDAAGLAISDKLKADSRVLGQAVRNVNDVISVLNIADGALAALTQIVTRQQELATQASNGTFSSVQRAALNKEHTQLSAEYRRIIETSNFNGVNVFDGQEGKINTQLGRDVLTVKTTETIVGTQTLTGTGSYNSTVVPFGETMADDSYYIVKDLNGDNINDLFRISLFDRGGGETRVRFATYLGQSSGTGFSELSNTQVDLNTSSYVGGSFNQSMHFDGANNVIFSASADGDTVEGTININSAGVITGYSGGSYSGVSNSSKTRVADFNGDGVLDFATDNGTSAVGFSIQQTTSSGGGGISTILNSAITNSTTSLATSALALSSLDSLNTIQSLVSSTRALVGASLSRIEVAGRISATTKIEYEAAGERIRSADVAKEAADLIRLNISRNAASSVLAQANQQPAIALNLLKNS
jgi:flagellin